MDEERRPMRRRTHYVPPLALTCALVLAACSAEPSAPPETELAGKAPVSDPVERAADAEVRTLLDAERLAEVIQGSGIDRLSAAQQTALATWLDEIRALAPAPPPLRYRLDTDRFDAASRTWKVDVKIPSLQNALGAPDCRLALVLEPRPGETGPEAGFTIVEARLALR